MLTIISSKRVFLRTVIVFFAIATFWGCSTRQSCNCDCQEPSISTPSYSKPHVVKPKPNYAAQVGTLRKKAAPHWGNQAKIATEYEFVKYAKNFTARTVINFETGVIRVETTAARHPKKVLTEVVAMTLLSTQNPETIDLFNDRYETQVGEPFLYDKVYDQDGQPIRWKWRANRYAKFLVHSKLQKDKIQTSTGIKHRYSVMFKMRQEAFSNHSTTHYASIVYAQARKHGINPALIFALIETESHFNPYATSAIPAYGLMQIVPESAGRDAWEYLRKSPGKPTSHYLYNPQNNIEMGSAYVKILLSRYLAEITNPKTREYCAIAAYNTGSGNVLRTFHKNRNFAINEINRLSPQAVYNRLRAKLPYKETRDYLKKVTQAKKRYL